MLCLRRHRREIENNYSNTRRVSLNWLRFLTAAAMFIWLLATTLSISDLGAHLSENDISLALALLVYAIGYMGLRQPEIFRYETADLSARLESTPHKLSEVLNSQLNQTFYDFVYGYRVPGTRGAATHHGGPDCLAMRAVARPGRS